MVFAIFPTGFVINFGTCFAYAPTSFFPILYPAKPVIAPFNVSSAISPILLPGASILNIFFTSFSDFNMKFNATRTIIIVVPKLHKSPPAIVANIKLMKTE